MSGEREIPDVSRCTGLILHGPAEELLEYLLAALPEHARPVNTQERGNGGRQGDVPRERYWENTNWLRRWIEWAGVANCRLKAVAMLPNGTSAQLRFQDAGSCDKFYQKAIQPGSRVLNRTAWWGMTHDLPKSQRLLQRLWIRGRDGTPFLKPERSPGTSGTHRENKYMATLFHTMGKDLMSTATALAQATTRKAAQDGEGTRGIGKDLIAATHQGFSTILACTSESMTLATLVQLQMANGTTQEGELQDWTAAIAARGAKGPVPVAKQITINAEIVAISAIGEGNVNRTWTRTGPASDWWTTIAPADKTACGEDGTRKTQTHQIERALGKLTSGEYGTYGVWAVAEKATMHPESTESGPWQARAQAGTPDGSEPRTEEDYETMMELFSTPDQETGRPTSPDQGAEESKEQDWNVDDGEGSSHGQAPIGEDTQGEEPREVSEAEGSEVQDIETETPEDTDADDSEPESSEPEWRTIQTRRRARQARRSAEHEEGRRTRTARKTGPRAGPRRTARGRTSRRDERAEVTSGMAENRKTGGKSDEHTDSEGTSTSDQETDTESDKEWQTEGSERRAAPATRARRNRARKTTATGRDPGPEETQIPRLEEATCGYTFLREIAHAIHEQAPDPVKQQLRQAWTRLIQDHDVTTPTSMGAICRAMRRLRLAASESFAPDDEGRKLQMWAHKLGDTEDHDDPVDPLQQVPTGDRNRRWRKVRPRVLGSFHLTGTTRHVNTWSEGDQETRKAGAFITTEKRGRADWLMGLAMVEDPRKERVSAKAASRTACLGSGAYAQTLTRKGLDLATEVAGELVPGQREGQAEENDETTGPETKRATRIATYNINGHGERRILLAAKEMETTRRPAGGPAEEDKADILVLTETHLDAAAIDRPSRRMMEAADAVQLWNTTGIHKDSEGDNTNKQKENRRGGVTVMAKKTVRIRRVGEAIPNAIFLSVGCVLIIAWYVLPARDRAGTELRRTFLDDVTRQVGTIRSEHPELTETMVVGDFNADPKRERGRQVDRTILQVTRTLGVNGPFRNAPETFQHRNGRSAIDHVVASSGIEITARTNQWKPWDNWQPPPQGKAGHLPLMTTCTMPTSLTAQEGRTREAVSFATTRIPATTADSEKEWKAFHAAIEEICEEWETQDAEREVAEHDQPEELEPAEAAESLIDQIVQAAEEAFGTKRRRGDEGPGARVQRAVAEKETRAFKVGKRRGPQGQESPRWINPSRFLPPDERGKVRKEERRLEEAWTHLLKERAQAARQQPANLKAAEARWRKAEEELRERVAALAAKLQRDDPRRFHDAIQGTILLGRAAAGEMDEWPAKLCPQSLTEIRDDMEAAERHAAYLRKLFVAPQAEENQGPTDERAEATGPDTEWAPKWEESLPEGPEGGGPNWEVAELQEALKAAAAKMKPHTATGVEGFQIGMIKGLRERTGDRVTRIMARLIAKMTKTGTFPVTWRTTIVTPVIKPGRNEDDPASYRPIAVAGQAARWVLGAIRILLVERIEPVLSPQQGGFRTGRRGVEPAAILSLLCTRSTGRIAVAMDLQSAYDMVSRGALQKLLQRIGIKEHWQMFILASFDANVFVRVGGAAEAVSLEGRRGLYQGNPLSPVLFDLALEPVLRYLNCPASRGRNATVTGKSSTRGTVAIPQWQGPGEKQFNAPGKWKWKRAPASAIGGTVVTALAFADDLLLIGGNPTVTQGLVDKTIIALTTLPGFILAPQKTAAAALGPLTGRYVGECLDVKGCQTPIEEALEFLGVRFERDMRFKRQKEGAAAAIRAEAGKMDQILRHGTPIPTALRAQMIDTYILSKSNYASELWAGRWSRMEDAQVEVARRLLGDKHRIVNRDLLRLDLGWPTFQARWQATTTRWLAAIARDMEAPEEQGGRKKPQSLMPALIHEQLQRIERNPEQLRRPGAGTFFAAALQGLQREEDEGSLTELWRDIREDTEARGTVLEGALQGARRGRFARQEWDRFLEGARTNGCLAAPWAILAPPGDPKWTPTRLSPAPYTWCAQNVPGRLHLRAGKSWIGADRRHRHQQCTGFCEKESCQGKQVEDSLQHRFIECPEAAEKLALLSGEEPPLADSELDRLRAILGYVQVATSPVEAQFLREMAASHGRLLEL